MSESREQRNEGPDSIVSLDKLYDTMSQEADGLYKQLITICTTFFGGSLLGGLWVFFENEKMFVGNAKCLLWLLFAAWVALTYPLAALVWIRWQNVESHRHVLEYLKTRDEEEYKKAKSIPKKGRKWMTSALISMVFGLVLIAVFTAMSIYYK